MLTRPAPSVSEYLGSNFPIYLTLFVIPNFLLLSVWVLGPNFDFATSQSLEFFLTALRYANIVFTCRVIDIMVKLRIDDQLGDMVRHIIINHSWVMWMVVNILLVCALQNADIGVFIAAAARRQLGWLISLK